MILRQNIQAEYIIFVQKILFISIDIFLQVNDCIFLGILKTRFLAYCKVYRPPIKFYKFYLNSTFTQILQIDQELFYDEQKSSVGRFNIKFNSNKIMLPKCNPTKVIYY